MWCTAINYKEYFSGELNSCMVQILDFDLPDGYSSSGNISPYSVRFLQSCISRKYMREEPYLNRETKTKRKIVRGNSNKAEISILTQKKIRAIIFRLFSKLSRKSSNTFYDIMKYDGIQYYDSFW